MDRETALSIVHEFVLNPALIGHMLAVEAAMRSYAELLGGDPDEWGLAGLLHDFDWEINPTADRHPEAGAPILRSRGVPEKIVRCILGHADNAQLTRQTPMEKALYACDEIAGLISAVALVRPSRSLHDLTSASVLKKWKDARFAANVNRDQIARGVQDLGVDLSLHIDRVIAAMRTIAPALGLDGPPSA